MVHIPIADSETMTAALARAAPVTLALRPGTAFCVVAQLQLALRHPANHGVSAELTRRVIEALASQLPLECRQVIQRGFDPAYDVSVPDPQSSSPLTPDP